MFFKAERDENGLDLASKGVKRATVTMTHDLKCFPLALHLFRLD